MKKRVSNVQSLRMAKLELRNDLEVRQARIEFEFERLKNHYIPDGLDTSEGIKSIIPSIVKPMVGNFLVHKLLKPKGKITSTLVKLLIATFFKK